MLRALNNKKWRLLHLLQGCGSTRQQVSASSVRTHELLLPFVLHVIYNNM